VLSTDQKLFHQEAQLQDPKRFHEEIRNEEDEAPPH
jgi:hypothetical protein